MAKQFCCHCSSHKEWTSCGYEYDCHSIVEDCDCCTGGLIPMVRECETLREALNYIGSHPWYDAETNARVGFKRVRRVVYEIWDDLHKEESDE